LGIQNGPTSTVHAQRHLGVIRAEEEDEKHNGRNEIENRYLARGPNMAKHGQTKHFCNLHIDVLQLTFQ